MTQGKYIIFIVCAFWASGYASAQNSERDYIRKGNKLFRDSSYVQSEVNYRKALEINPNSTEALYNLGNSLSKQGKLKESIEKYTAASKVEKNRIKLAKIYHNAGFMFQSAKRYQEAVQAYRQSLRNNPNDDETRYNLSLAQKMLKNQPQNKDKNKDKDKDKNKDKDKKEDQKKKQDQKNKNDKQPPKPQDSKKNQMSKENAEQLLNAAMQDEKQLQEKVKKQLRNQGGNLEKDW